MNYLITFDQSIADTQSQVELHRVLTNLPGTSDWWHYIPNVYIVISSQTSSVISDQIYKMLPALRFLVAKISLDDSNGVLQKDAWDWINKHKAMATPLKTILKAGTTQSTRLPAIPPNLPFLRPSNTNMPPIKTLSDILFKIKK